MPNDTSVPVLPREGLDRRARLFEVARLFLRLGFTAFGGPAAHVALMEHEVVTRRRWLDRQHFLDLLGAVNFIPGPNSTELAIHLGLIRAGRAGLLVAGACFIVPAMLIILPLGWLYVTYGTRPQVVPALGAVSAALVAVILAAVTRFARTSIKDMFTGTIAILALALAYTFRDERRFPPELAILTLSALCGAVRYTNARRSSLCVVASVPGLLGAITTTAPVIASSRIVSMFLMFLRVGATLFGSGYVLVNYLHTGVVAQHHWMTEPQLLDAIAVGQVTPGPLLTTATFIGFFLGDRVFGGGVPLGIGCGVLATAAIFLPSFLFILILAPVLDRLRRNPAARGALDAMNAAVVSLIVVTALRLAVPALYDRGTHHVLWLHVAIALGSLAVLLRTSINATWLILIAALLGAAAG